MLKHKKWLTKTLEEFIADSGYCSKMNLSNLKENNIESFIKLQEHEKKNTKCIIKQLVSITTWKLQYLIK